ncbi:MAG: helix-turn-helix transcriptional regulator [Verrucomicrobia bacterium]|nr:helix-turn-helix transcriptional regulator [Verrucomicrobiota bacterium]
MRAQRLSCEERKEAIVKAVLPIFARNGFANTTTRELAKAAGVSEALLYKHFPSKESLYAEIQTFGCRGCDPGLQKLISLEPSTSTLVYIVYYIMRINIVGRGKEAICAETRHRMILNSCLEDGSFSRFLFHNRFAENISKIVECMDAAAAAGDMVSSPVSKPNLLLFAHHLATMIATMHLPKKPVVDYEATREELVQQAVWFALRGVGLRDDAIKRHYNPKTLALFFSEDR